MNRRSLITLLGGAVAWPLAARALPPDRVRRIGVLMGSAQGDPQAEAGLAAFTTALRELGWTPGGNVKIDTRWGAADVDRMQGLRKSWSGCSPT
jgi:putative tryptophan/tyrosine transport system substrate-binding protein